MPGAASAAGPRSVPGTVVYCGGLWDFLVGFLFLDFFDNMGVSRDF